MAEKKGDISPRTRFTAIRDTADAAYKELKQFTDERRMQTSARRLVSLSSETVFTTTMTALGGLVTAAILATLHVIGGLTFAGICVPLSMSIFGGAGVLTWRSLRPRFDRRTPLDLLRDELQQLDADPKAPKSYRDAVYKLREQALSQRLGIAPSPNRRLLNAAQNNFIDLTPETATAQGIVER